MLTLVDGLSAGYFKSIVSSKLKRKGREAGQYMFSTVRVFIVQRSLRKKSLQTYLNQ